jgi:hypothetical protein
VGARHRRRQAAGLGAGRRAHLARVAARILNAAVILTLIASGFC